MCVFLLKACFVGIVSTLGCNHISWIFFLTFYFFFNSSGGWLKHEFSALPYSWLSGRGSLPSLQQTGPSLRGERTCLETVVGEGIGVFHHFCPLLQISELINRPIPHQGEGAFRLPGVWLVLSGRSLCRWIHSRGMAHLCWTLSHPHHCCAGGQEGFGGVSHFQLSV